MGIFGVFMGHESYDLHHKNPMFSFSHFQLLARHFPVCVSTTFESQEDKYLLRTYDIPGLSPSPAASNSFNIIGHPDVLGPGDETVTTDIIVELPSLAERQIITR